MLLLQILQSFLLKNLWNIKSADFASFGVKVKISELHMFNFDLDQLADTRSGCSKVSDHKIPGKITVFFELIFQKIVICIADHIFQKVFLLNLYRLQTKPFFFQHLKKFVNSLYPQIYSFGFIVLQQKSLVLEQIFLVNYRIMIQIKPDRIHISGHRIFRHIAPSEKGFILLQHNTSYGLRLGI